MFQLILFQHSAFKMISKSDKHADKSGSTRRVFCLLWGFLQDVLSCSLGNPGLNS